MKKIVVTILLQILYLNIYSQNVVVDETNKQSIPNVNITIKNTNKGFITDSNGVFYLNNKLKKEDVLVFTAIGYEKTEVAIVNIMTLQEVILSRKTENLEEVELTLQKKEIKIVQLGVIKRKKSVWKIVGKNQMITTLINPINNRDDGIIKEFIFKNLKVKFNSTHNVNPTNKCPKFKNVRVKNKVAIKLQLYSVNEKTQLPNTDKPLINDNIVILLNKNINTLKFDISKYNIFIPKNGIFTTLEIIDVYDTNSKVDFLKESHVLMYNISGNINNAVSYHKYKGYEEWIKHEEGNAIFSLKVAYPIKK